MASTAPSSPSDEGGCKELTKASSNIIRGEVEFMNTLYPQFTWLGYESVDMKFRRSRGPDSSVWVERKYTAGIEGLAQKQEVAEDYPLYLLALGLHQGVFEYVQTVEDVWERWQRLSIKPEAERLPVFQDARGRAWRYYDAMEGYSRKARLAGLIQDGEKAVFYNVKEAGTYEIEGARGEDAHILV